MYKVGFPILKNVSFEIPGGDKIAIIGKNGTGKTTILELIAGFISPSYGKIKLYGREMNEIGLEKVRELIAYIPQKSHIFQKTVRDNIDLKKRDEFDKIEAVCKATGAYDFIKDLPLKYNTKLGADGKKLSSGEEKRIIEARMLLKEAPIILIDEPENSLDHHSVEKLKKIIDRKMKEKTVIIVTHSEAFVQLANKVLRISPNGTIEMEMKK